MTESFSHRIKGELAAVPIVSIEQAASEMSALLYTASTTSWDDQDGMSIRIASRDASVARRAAMLAAPLLDGYAPDLPDPPGHITWTGEPARRILIITGLLGDQGWFAPSDVERPSSVDAIGRAAFLRGSFLGGGSAADPAKEYHLEFVTPDGRLAGIWMELLADLRLSPGSVTRKRQMVVYIKEAERIATLLTVMGASASRLTIEDARILKDMRNRVNRATNCDAANLDKAVDAADRHIRAIHSVMRADAMDALPDPLREAAEARLKHPELSLVELGVSMNPPIGKSGMHHRLRRIEELARSLPQEYNKGSPQ